jgi:thioester reductase-like protein
MNLVSPIHEFLVLMNTILQAVNFNLGLPSFEDQHIKGTHNLLNFTLSVRAPHPPRFLFCSSVSVASKMPPPVTIPESLVQDLNAANMGYGKSKLVAEHIVNNTVLSTGIDCRIIRIGQIVGDGQMGLWNDSESIPLIIRSALTLGCLPRLNEVCVFQTPSALNLTHPSFLAMFVASS